MYAYIHNMYVKYIFCFVYYTTNERCTIMVKVLLYQCRYNVCLSGCSACLLYYCIKLGFLKRQCNYDNSRTLRVTLACIYTILAYF